MADDEDYGLDSDDGEDEPAPGPAPANNDGEEMKVDEDEQQEDELEERPEIAGLDNAIENMKAFLLQIRDGKGLTPERASELLKEVPLTDIFGYLGEAVWEFPTISTTLEAVFDAKGLGAKLLKDEVVQGALLLGLATEDAPQIQILALRCCGVFASTDELASDFLKSKYVDPFWTCFTIENDEVNDEATQFLGLLCQRAPYQKYILDLKNVKALTKKIESEEARLRLIEAVSANCSGTKFLASPWYNQVLEWLTGEDILTKLNAIQVMAACCGPTTYKQLNSSEVVEKFISTSFAEDASKQQFSGQIRSRCLKLLTALMEVTNRTYIEARDAGKLSEVGNQFQGVLALKALAGWIGQGLDSEDPNQLEAALALTAHVCYNPKGIKCGPVLLPKLGALVDHKDTTVQAIALRSLALVLETKAPGSKYAKQQQKAAQGVKVGDKEGLDAIVARAAASDGILHNASLHCMKNLFEQEFGVQLVVDSKDAVDWLTEASGPPQTQMLKKELCKLLLTNKASGKQLPADVGKKLKAWVEAR